MQQILTDRTVLRAMRAEAESARNYVEKYFCDTLLAVISDLLPDDHEPSGVELRCTVMLKAVEQLEEPDEREDFLSKLGELVDALKVRYLCLTTLASEQIPGLQYMQYLHGHSCQQDVFVLQTSLMPTETIRLQTQEEIDAGVAPKRSPKELAALEAQRHKQKLSYLEELLAVTADMPEEKLPISQEDIVQELACLDVVEPLLQCMNVRESPEARLQSAGVPVHPCVGVWAPETAVSLHTCLPSMRMMPT